MPPMEHRHEHAGGGDAGTRTVWDPAAARAWRVWSADCRDVPGARSDDCLIFDSGTTVRRLWSPPDDWRALSDAALLALLEARRSN